MQTYVEELRGKSEAELAAALSSAREQCAAPGYIGESAVKDCQAIEAELAERRLAAAESDIRSRFERGGAILTEERIHLSGGALLVVRIFDGSPLAYFLTPERGRPAFAIERRAAVNRIAEETPTAKDRASRTLYGRVLAARQAERV